jgi:hypothetical protein
LTDCGTTFAVVPAAAAFLARARAWSIAMVSAMFEPLKGSLEPEGHAADRVLHADTASSPKSELRLLRWRKFSASISANSNQVRN